LANGWPPGVVFLGVRQTCSIPHAMEFAMIPLLAATGVINTVNNIVNTAISQSTPSAATSLAAGKKVADSDPGSFASLLSAHGVSSSGAVGLGTKAIG
jgi:hypothetical protein